MSLTAHLVCAVRWAQRIILNVCLCMQLAAKCETRQALFNFQAITEASDAIIMSRGNLGLDVLPEKMALAQKAVISNCNLLGKPVLITRVVDTMVSAPRPTRCALMTSCTPSCGCTAAWTLEVCKAINMQPWPLSCSEAEGEASLTGLHQLWGQVAISMSHASGPSPAHKDSKD